MSANVLAYAIHQIAPVSCDVLIDGALVAPLVHGIHERGIVDARRG